MGLKNVIMTDRTGAIYKGREGLNPIKEEMAELPTELRKGYPGRSDQGRRRIRRCIRTGRSDQRNGTDHGKGCDHLCMRKPDTGNLPG